MPAPAPAKPSPPHGERRKGAPPGPGPELDGGETSLGTWSEEELLRRKDFASMTPEEFDKFLRGDIVKWAEVVKRFVDKPQ